MKLRSDNLQDNAPIDSKNAFGKYDAGSHVALCDNKSPHLAFSDIPEGALSLALICHDPDVPSRGDDVNQEGKVVPKDLPREDFFHWLLVDIPVDASPLVEGEFSDGITARGKAGPAGPRGMRQGLNDYTAWFASDPDMAGKYFGYDGPCPPWNDSLMHHYHFTLFALDVARVAVDGEFDGATLRQAMEGHILGTAALVGSYAINPDATEA